MGILGPRHGPGRVSISSSVFITARVEPNEGRVGVKVAMTSTSTNQADEPQKIEADEPQKKWTVMVFMGASTFEGNVSLDAAADADIKEMEAVSSLAGRLNIFVERHDDQGVRRYHIGKPKGGFNKAGLPLGMLDGRALERFVLDSLKAAEHRRSDYTMLVLWGDAYKFLFGRSRTRDGTVDALDWADLSDSLSKVQDQMWEWYESQEPTGSEERPTLDIIGFDACELSSVEMACQLQPCAQYLLGSEIGIPIPGWPYDRILDRIRSPQGDRMMGPAEFGTYVVRRFCESYEANEDQVSLSLLDLAHTAELTEHVGWLALKLASAIKDPDMLNRIADLFLDSQTDAGRPYVDVADLCVNLTRESGDAPIIVAATALGDFLASPGPGVVGQSETGEGRPLVVEHGRNAGKLARLQGISLYAPHVATNYDFAGARDLYNKFVFAQDTVWGQLVHALTRS